MRFFSRLFSYGAKCLGFYRPARPQDIPKKLPPQALQEAILLASKLRTLHSVQVKELEPGELPSIPRRADDS